MSFFLFTRHDITTCFSNRLQEVKEKIDKLSDNEITAAELSELEKDYYNSYEAHPLQIIDDKISSYMEEIENPPNRFHRFSDKDQDQYNTIKIHYKIPIDGDSNLLYYAPSIPCRYECQGIIDSSETECGYVLLEMDFNRQALEQNMDNMQKIVDDTLQRRLAPLRKIIEYLNNDVKDYNSKLRSTIQEALNTRLKRAQSLRNISQKLSIPLKLSENAPNTKPIVLKRIVKPTQEKPKGKKLPDEYTILDEDYNNINNIIYMCGSSMEITAKSHINNDEEELRDIILATLNTHYENASGETFRKNGKTDINVLFETQAAFIGECKIWQGEKVFDEAVHQLLSYSTWKDTKVTLVIFNKKNKDFRSILTKIEKWITENAKSHTKISANRWDCIYHREEMNIDIKLHIVAFDLCVEKV